MSLNRRQFAKLGLTATGALVSCPSVLHFRQEDVEPEICFFSKPFVDVPFEKLAQKTSELELAGLEAPVRSGGHIEPANVAEELPLLVKTLGDHGRKITIVASDVNDANDATQRTVLETAAKLGIRYYRLKYLRYEKGRSIKAQWEDFRVRLAELASLNQELGLTGLYQNHPGENTFGASLWDLAHVLEEIDPTHLGMAFDIRHAMVEANTSWPNALKHLAPHIQAVYVKDFAWRNNRVANTPLGDGLVNQRIFNRLKEFDFSGPISLHVEYLKRTPEMIPKHWEAFQEDLKTLRSWL